MDIHVNDILKMKKPHPCGSQEWLVLRVGMDFKLRCQGCGHEVMLPRSKAEKYPQGISGRQRGGGVSLPSSNRRTEGGSHYG